MLRDLPPFARDEGHDVFMNGAPGNEQEQESQTYVDPFDDVFGSAPGSPTLGGDDSQLREQESDPPPRLDHSDISRLRSTHVTNGYREGIAASKELHMQDGFDEGYNLGAELGLMAGWCLGALEGILRALPAQRTMPSSDETVSGGGNAIHAECTETLEKAKLELDISELCGAEYFGEDGLWLYDVPGQKEDDVDVTFETVVAAHPSLRKWKGEVSRLSQQLGLQLGGE